ncbi:MAG: glycosyltransferase [Candidatus Bathyarchaeia archaeon]
MNILQVVPFFSPVHGGSSVVPYNLSKELAERGHDVTLYTSNYKLSWEWVKSLSKVNVYPFKTRSNLAEFYVTPGIMNHMGEEIKRFDIIHLHNYRTFQNIIVSRYAKKYNVPYVLQAHGSLPRIAEKHRLKWIYDVFFGYESLRNSSNVIALSQTEAQQYRDMGVPEEKIAVIPNGIDLSEYANLPPKGSFKKKFGIKEDEKIVLYLARIHKIKGIDILAKAFANVIKKLDDVRLVVVGPDDGYLGELESLVRALKIEDKVLISGALYGRDKLEAYVDADVYVLPSRYETFPMSVLEAIACGTPTILTENCGIAEYFRDKTGLVVKTDSPSHLQEALLEMLMNREKQKVFRKNCETVTQKFNISETVSKLEEAYEELL